MHEIIRNIVGATKISLSTLLIVGVFYNEVVLASSLSMAFLMVCAQIAHIKVKNPLIKYVPSFILLILSLFVAGVNYGII
jgi:hypothetical protein